MNYHTDEQPKVNIWLLPGGNVLLSAVEEGEQSTVTLTVTVPGSVDGLRAAFAKLLAALEAAKEAAL
jgi:hypothetical protein